MSLETASARLELGVVIMIFETVLYSGNFQKALESTHIAEARKKLVGAGALSRFDAMITLFHEANKRPMDELISKRERYFYPRDVGALSGALFLLATGEAINDDEQALRNVTANYSQQIANLASKLGKSQKYLTGSDLGEAIVDGTFNLHVIDECR